MPNNDKSAEEAIHHGPNLRRPFHVATIIDGGPKKSTNNIALLQTRAMASGARWRASAIPDYCCRFGGG